MTLFWIALTPALVGITIGTLIYITWYSPGAIRRFIAIPIPEEATGIDLDIGYSPFNPWVGDEAKVHFSLIPEALSGFLTQTCFDDGIPDPVGLREYNPFNFHSSDPQWWRPMDTTVYQGGECRNDRIGKYYRILIDQTHSSMYDIYLAVYYAE